MTVSRRMVVDDLEPDASFTAVHCTHTAAEDMEPFGRAGANVCLCPNTEGNLGDGIADVPLMRRSGASIAIGTDLNSRLCPLEELRWLEYVQRVARRQRGVIVDTQGESGPALLDVGTRNGARSLGLDTGVIRVGACADFCAIDLESHALADVAHETMGAATQGSATTALAAAMVFGAGVESVAATSVNGKWRRRRGARLLAV